jgi:hypothetical protein
MDTQTSFREQDDILLVRTVTRDVDARTTVLTAARYNIALFVNWLAAILASKFSTWLAIFLLMGGPFIVGICFGVYGALKRRRAAREFEKLTLWERRHFNLLLQRAVDKAPEAES